MELEGTFTLHLKKYYGLQIILITISQDKLPLRWTIKSMKSKSQCEEEESCTS